MNQIPLTKKKRISHFFVRRFSPFLEKINHNALFVNYVDSHADIPRFRTRDDVHKYINSYYYSDGNDAVDYLEFGVYQGASMKLWSEINMNQQSRFFGFDSFEGLPESWRPGFEQGTFDVGGSLPEINDDRTRFIKGWFHESLPPFLDIFETKHRLVIHNDSDLYSSTLYCLTTLDCRKLLMPGTILIFDEFGDPSHEFRALNDYASAFGRKWNAVAATENFWTVAVILE
jgi:hypothetical protein